MDILVCFSSLARHSDVAFPSIKKHVIDVLPETPDIAGHFPLSEKHVEEPLRRMGHNCSIVLEEDPLLEDALHSKQKNICPSQKSHRNNLLQWHSLKRCADVKKKMEKQRGKLYDWVIWLRPDLYFLNDIDDLKTCDNAFLYLPGHDGHHGYNDRFCFGNSENMDKRMRIFDFFSQWTEPMNGTWNAEMVLRCHLQQEAIPLAKSRAIFGMLRRFQETCIMCGNERCLYMSKPVRTERGPLREYAPDDEETYKRLQWVKEWGVQGETVPCLHLEHVQRALSHRHVMQTAFDSFLLKARHVKAKVAQK